MRFLVNEETQNHCKNHNELQFTMSNLSNNIQNIEASRSSVENADFASKATAKSQILEQSVTVILFQSSSLLQNILGFSR
ncbi:hypothetical protein CMK22_19960 [Candidatus Poribacteria bacterium]|nr:hypothetical protein [Candidatus Poribacteria bacterium]